MSIFSIKMIPSRILLIVSCLCFAVFVNAQNTLESALKIEDIKVKTTTLEKILKAQDTVVHTEKLGTLYHELGNCYDKQQEYDKALPFFKKAKQVRSKFNNVLKYNHSRYKLSLAYLKTGKFKEKQAILLEMIHDLGTDKYTSYAHRLLGRDARDNGDVPQSLRYLNLGLANKALCQNLKFDSNLRYEIISTYAKKYESTFKSSDSNADLNIIQEHEKLILVDSLRAENKPVLHNSLAVIYDTFGDFSKSLYYYKKALNYYVEHENKYDELNVVNNIAIIYSRQKKYLLANQLYNQVLQESDDEEQIATAYNAMGYYKNTAIVKEKLVYLEKAISVVLERKVDKFQAFYLPTLDEIKKSGYQQEVLIYLIDLASHYVQTNNQENDKTYLIKAKKTVTLIDQLVSLIRYETDAEASKLFWIEKGVNTYMLAVEICYLLDDAASAFYFMEKNKALLLQENIKTLQTKFTFNIPAKLQKREYSLYYDLLTLEEQLQQSLVNENVKENYSLKNKEYQTFMDSMQRMYPEYIKLKEEVEIIALTTVMQEYTAQNDAFVEYILHETDGFGIYYDSGEPLFFKILDVPTFQKKLHTLKEFMKKRQMNPSEIAAFHELGFTIFQQLFPFKNPSERLKNKKITIIPDQELQYIPFEILPTQRNGELLKVYFVNNTETSYLQSFSLLQQIKKKQNSPTKKLLAIAPYEFKDSTLPTLTGTEKVLEFLSKYDSSVLLTKKDASKANFLKLQDNFEIIHINTHAGLDDKTQKPWIAFNEEKMSLNELIGFENQADLVILDACKTNDGIHLSGEGVRNLSRGFFYNGTQSVMASLWNVNEQAGNEILAFFYDELAKGTSKSKALQIAKITYLQKHEFSQNTPYYWAAFTLTGSTNSLTLQTTQNYTYIFIGVTILVCLAIFFYYRKKISA